MLFSPKQNKKKIAVGKICSRMMKTQWKCKRFVFFFGLSGYIKFCRIAFILNIDTFNRLNFYSPGVFGLLISASVAFFVFENPSSHPRISKAELHLILSDQENVLNKRVRNMDSCIPNSLLLFIFVPFLGEKRKTHKKATLLENWIVLMTRY